MTLLIKHQGMTWQPLALEPAASHPQTYKFCRILLDVTMCTGSLKAGKGFSAGLCRQMQHKGILCSRSLEIVLPLKRYMQVVGS